MKNVSYDFSSVHIDLPKSLADEIMAWGKKHIHDNDIFVSQSDPNFGREDEIHATVLYGIHSDKSDQVRELVKDEKPLSVKLDKIEVFDNPPNFDVVVIKVVSEDMNRLNTLFSQKIKHTNKYKEFRPHVTVAYVKKGKGYKHKKVKDWIGREFKANYLVFSSTKGTKEKIFLG
jgi:2'-5' RNA ligase